MFKMNTSKSVSVRVPSLLQQHEPAARDSAGIGGVGWEAYAPEVRYCTVLVVLGRGSGRLMFILNINLPMNGRCQRTCPLDPFGCTRPAE